MTTVLRWQVGEIRISRIQEFEGPGMRFLLPDATVENLAEVQWVTPYLDADGEAVGSVHSLVIEAGDQRIVVDTCIGNDKQRMPMRNWHLRSSPFLEDFEAAGFGLDTIDTVAMTHLHTDHVGWNTRLVDDQWVPTFGRARTVMTEAEWAHASVDENEIVQATLADSVRPLFDADLVDLVEADHELAPGVRFEPTPGHTPGHVSVHIASRGEHAVITGDLLHHPVQMARLGWRNNADDDHDRADATRRAFLDRYADTPTLVIGTHFSGATAGHVVRDGDAYRLDA